MPSFLLHKRIWLFLLMSAITLIGSCEAPRPYPPPVSYFYVAPSVAYLRACPSYGDECVIVEQLYAGERVIYLDRNDYGWSYVRSERTGAAGWIVSDLLTTIPSPAIYFVTWTTAHIRECNDFHCRPLELLARGDQVEKLDQDNRGWWRVMSLRSRTQGWIPAAALSVRPGPPLYYVAVTSLALREGPTTASRLLATLAFNQQVEMIDMAPAGWAKVRDISRGLVGWVAVRYLEGYPVAAPRPVPARRQAPAKKAAPEPEKASKEASPKETPVKEAPTEAPPKAPAPVPRIM